MQSNLSFGIRHTENQAVSVSPYLSCPFHNTDTTTENTMKKKRKDFKTEQSQEYGGRGERSLGLILYRHLIWGNLCIFLATRIVISIQQRAVTRNGSWGTPATASTPGFHTSLEHRFNSSCIIRLKRPSTPPALYISISTRTGVMDVDENRAPQPRRLLCSKEEENPTPGAQIGRHPANRWIYGELSSPFPSPIGNP